MVDNPNLIRTPSLDSPHYASQRPEPSWERLNAPCSRVWVKNTSEMQTHIVIDKYNNGHELKPGERQEMEMLNEEIAAFQSHSLPDRYFPVNDPAMPGRPKPKHPIQIEGVASMIELEREHREAVHAEAARKKHLQELRDWKEMRDLERLKQEDADLQNNRKVRS
jgi:hypothetical protein